MASSTLSLDSLSSPSPSPSPPPMDQTPLSPDTGAPATSTAAPFRAIDTDSELSELTDDDQDASTAAEKRAASTATASSSKGPGGPAIDDDDDTPATGSRALAARPNRLAQPQRGMPRYANSSRRVGPGRKKRSSIVPAPMWGWVPEKTAANAAVVEEEEEEMTGPPRAMEEEEEEDEEIEEEEGDEYDVYDHGNDSGAGEDEELAIPRGFASQRRNGPYSSKRMPYGQPNSAKTRGTATRQSAGAARRNPRKQDDDYEEEDGDDDPLTAEKRPRQAPSRRIPPKHDNGDVRLNGQDDEGSVSGGSEYLASKRKKATRSRAAASASRKRKESGNEESSGSDVLVSSRTKNGVNQRNGGHDEDNEGSASNPEDHTDSDGEAPKPASPQPLSPARLTNSKLVPAILPNMVNSSTSALNTLATAANLFDPTHSPVRETSSINAPAASIALAGGATSSAEVPQSGNTSDIGTRHASRSRSHSRPVDSDAEDGADEAKAVKGKAKGGKPASRGSRSKTRGKPPPADKKNLPVAVNGDAPKAANATKKGPPVPLDLKIDTSVPNVIATGQDMDIDEEANDPVDDQDVDMDPSERDNEEEDDEDGEDEVDGASAHEEDEEPEPVEEEAAEVDNDVDEEAIDADDDVPDQDGDDDPDQEQENEQDAVEVEQENEEGEDGDNDDEEPSADADVDVDVEDHESDLQPAHRAEALDVLATIELKFALLRERVYVEKMDALAWEEMLVQNSAHPELLHLQKELSKRRDKRLELASRKRSYEVANAVTRRLADESNTWSWWQFSRDDLQTELIAETSRKRRKLERERRAIERPQPMRRIPHLMEVVAQPMGPPSLRKIIKAYPFGSRKQNKSDTHHHHHHSHSHYPKNLVYPEISTLSTTDIQSDIDFLAHQRRSLAYDQQLQQPPHYPSQLQRNVSGMNGMGMGRAMSLGIGMPNGALPPVPATQSSMGPPPPGSISHQHMQQHGMGYEPYGDIAHAFGPPGAPGRVREQYGAQGPGGLLPGGPPPPGNPRDGYSNFPPGSRLAPSSHGPPMLMSGGQHHGYPSDHEMSTMAPGGPSNNGIGHQIHPNHPYFGQGSMGPGGGGSAHGSSAGHMSSHHPGNMKGGMNINGRRSMSPVHAMPNGTSGSKNGWIGGGIDTGGFHGGSNGKGGNWDVQMMHEDEERDRAMRKRDRDEREKEKELQRDREAERDRLRREREYDLERERHGHSHMQAPQQHRQQPPNSSHSGLSHIHSAGSASGPPPPQAQANTHVLHNHHHHRAHHHHVVHRHHTQQGSQHASSSMPHSGGAPPIVHSPRSTREYERPLPPQGSMHTGPGQGHPTELITLSSNKREASGHWPSKNIDEPQHHPNMVDYRDREREALSRERPERDSRKMVSGRRSTGPAIPPLDDRSDRPMAMPFVMASSHTMQQTAAGMPSAHLNGSGLSSSTSSPRGAPSWNGAGGLEDPSYRMSSSAPPPSGYLGSPHDTHLRSPVQGHRYASSSGSHVPPPLGRMGGSTSSSGIHHRMASPPPQSGRSRPPPSPSYAAHLSPVTSPKPRPLSPVGAGKHILSGPLPGPGYASSPHLSGPGRASTPTGPQTHASSSLGPPPLLDGGMKNGGGPVYGGSRTASPLMASLPRASMNGASGDRDRERASPRLGAPSVPLAPPPSKLGAAQMVDGH